MCLAFGRLREAVLKQHQLTGKLNLVEGSMSVSTTRQTWDPYAIVKARDFIKLISRNVPIAQAQKIFQSEITCDIIKIGLKSKNRKRFVKRRDRLVGPQAQTLKALEVLTNCYVLVQGKDGGRDGPVERLRAGAQDRGRLHEEHTPHLRAEAAASSNASL